MPDPSRSDRDAPASPLPPPLADPEGRSESSDLPWVREVHRLLGVFRSYQPGLRSLARSTRSIEWDGIGLVFCKWRM